MAAGGIYSNMIDVVDQVSMYKDKLRQKNHMRASQGSGRFASGVNVAADRMFENK